MRNRTRKQFRYIRRRMALLLCAAFLMQGIPMSVSAGRNDAESGTDAKTVEDTESTKNAESGTDAENAETQPGAESTEDAQKIEGKTVRVGWYQSSLFQTGRTDEEEKSGYSYDYLQAVSDYTTWNYQYVYGDWSELMDMLENGEIDFLAGVSITQERQQKMLFPDTAMGTEMYYLCKRSDDTSISAGNLLTLNGKKIGLIANNLMSAYARKWITKNGINLEIVDFDGFDSLTEAFESGQIDLITTTYDGASPKEAITVIAETGEEDYYMAVSSARPDLLEELNSAVSTMLSINTYALENLRYKAYGSGISGTELTEGEKQWLAEHPTVRVGYIDDYLPYSDLSEEGKAEEIVVDALKEVFEILGTDNTPTLVYTAYTGYDEIAQALINGEIDLAFPVTNNAWMLEQDRVDASAEVVSGSGTLFYRSAGDKDDINKIAVNRTNALQIEYSGNAYPDAELVYYDSIDACLDSVLKRETDGTIMDTMRIQYVTGQSKYDSLFYLQMNLVNGKSFGVRHGNTDLLLLLNRAIALLGESYGAEYAYPYISEFYTYSWWDFIQDHWMKITLAFTAAVILILFVMFRRLKSKEAELREKEKLKEQAEVASKAKSEFLFNMSHDIRTPMNAVLGFTELMEKEIDDPKRLKDHLGKIKKAGEYLLGLINNMLEVARIDSGKETLDITIMDVKDIGYLSMFETELTRKNLTFEKESDVTHRYAYGDRQKIREIVLNLLSNAIKYTPDGGTIRASIREIPCEISGYAAYVTTVADTGIGMKKEFLDQIFESFSREHNSTESRVMGTGLGMSIVKKLVDLMDGTIAVDSVQGKGTTFTVTVNLRIAENGDALPADGENQQEFTEGDLVGTRILLAEDNELNAEITMTLLAETGAQIDLAKDGVECVDRLMEAPAGTYDLVLMDIQMPNLNGYEATKRIRQLEDQEKASIPIIAMTANAFDEDRKNALAAGMNGHLPKPVDVRILKETVESVLLEKRAEV